MGWWPFSNEQNSKTQTANVCPVDHKQQSITPNNDACPVDHSKFANPNTQSSNSAAPAACPVDHKAWEAANVMPQFPGLHDPKTAPRDADIISKLSDTRQISSIPKLETSTSYEASPEGHAPLDSSQQDSNNWVYPSEKQFHEALMRKHNKSSPQDMPVVVPIHNAVNERAWSQLLDWERVALNLNENDPVPTKLVSFIGRPTDLTPRARFLNWIGYTKPFDRHDWIVDRNGDRIRYVLDFYTGKRLSPDMPASFFIDCRPAIDDVDSAFLRFKRWWSQK